MEIFALWIVYSMILTAIISLADAWTAELTQSGIGFIPADAGGLTVLTIIFVSFVLSVVTAILADQS